MRFLGWLAILVAVIGLSGCGSKFKRYNGPEVTQVQVHKADRKMYLLHNDKVLKSYDIALGFAPVGHKQFEGDGKTPEGQYFISHKNPDSQYHLSLGISYPNPTDIAFAKAEGKSPGGDIFIHGQPNALPDGLKVKGDWTAGCIALTNPEIEEIFANAAIGTEVEIRP